MTLEEALELFKDHDYWADISYIDEACILAISALEKQIPKNPILKEYRFAPTGVFFQYHCPTCDGSLHKPYPCVCGQAIDWSD